MNHINQRNKLDKQVSSYLAFLKIANRGQAIKICKEIAKLSSRIELIDLMPFPNQIQKNGRVFRNQAVKNEFQNHRNKNRYEQPKKSTSGIMQTHFRRTQRFQKQGIGIGQPTQRRETHKIHLKKLIMEPNKKPENPSVYPDPMRGAEPSYFNQEPRELSKGTTLRDDFAAKAMQAFITKYGVDKEYGTTANESYKVADSMLKQREL